MTLKSAKFSFNWSNCFDASSKTFTQIKMTDIFYICTNHNNYLYIPLTTNVAQCIYLYYISIPTAYLSLFRLIHACMRLYHHHIHLKLINIEVMEVNIYSFHMISDWPDSCCTFRESCAVTFI